MTKQLKSEFTLISPLHGLEIEKTNCYKQNKEIVLAWDFLSAYHVSFVTPCFIP